MGQLLEELQGSHGISDYLVGLRNPLSDSSCHLVVRYQVLLGDYLDISPDREMSS